MNNKRKTFLDILRRHSEPFLLGLWACAHGCPYETNPWRDWHPRELTSEERLNRRCWNEGYRYGERIRYAGR